VLGYPIRKPPDQRSVANSPGHIAGSHVLHRLLMPRHPPCALKNLNTTTTRCSRSLCSSQNTNGHHPTPPPTPNPTKQTCGNHQMRYGGQAGPYAQTPTRRPGGQSPKRTEDTSNTTKTPWGFGGWPVSSGPNSVLDHPGSSGDGFPEPTKRWAVLTSPEPARGDRIASAPPMS
jgi:hypothetical protein